MIIVLWIMLSIVVAVVASTRGRDSTGYFILSLIVSPIIGLLVVMATPPLVYVDANGVQRRVLTQKEWLIQNDPGYNKRQRIWETIVAIGVLVAIFIAIGVGLSGA